jgi:hypothetical protein
VCRHNPAPIIPCFLIHIFTGHLTGRPTSSWSRCRRSPHCFSSLPLPFRLRLSKFPCKPRRRVCIRLNDRRVVTDTTLDQLKPQMHESLWVDSYILRTCIQIHITNLTRQSISLVTGRSRKRRKTALDSTAHHSSSVLLWARHSFSALTFTQGVRFTAQINELYFGLY